METFLCLGGMVLIAAFLLFSYLLNTARKKGTVSTNIAGKRDLLPVYISLADKPESIIRGMDKFKMDSQKTESAGDKWRWIPMIIFVAGVGLLLIDVTLWLLGYSSFIFILGGVLLWVASVVLARSLRKSDLHDFSPRYDGAQEILHTLRDDLRPNSSFLGHLDLTGALLPTKMAHTAKDTQNRTTEYFRDEWLALKAKLYDGNILRISAIQKSKKRKSYWKTGRVSGKSKLKPEKYKGSQQDLKVRIVVNPELYSIEASSSRFKPGLNIGKFTVSQLSTDGGIINFVAHSPFEEVEHENILTILQSAYSLLKRKAA